MKSKVWALTKVFLKCSFANMGSKKETNNKKQNSLKWILLYSFLMIYMGTIMGTLSFGMISSLKIIGQEQVFLSLFFLALGVLFLIQSVASCMNIFYFSKDIEYVLPFPVKPIQILMAKFNVMLITEHIVGIMFGLVPLILYGILTGANILYYILAIIALLAFPILPIVIAAILVMAIMSFAKLTKDRDKFQVIATILIIVIVIGMQFMLNGQEELTDEQIALKLVEANGMADMVSGYIPTLKPITNALTAPEVGNSILEMAKVIGITFAFYVIFILIGQKLYLRGALSSRSGGGTKQQKINIEKAYRRKRISISYVIKEIKILFRNPIYFTQCILPSLLMPIVFLVAFIAGAGGNQSTVRRGRI